MKMEIKSASGSTYEVDLAAVTCTCQDFKFKRSRYSKGDEARMCKHLIEARRLNANITIKKDKVYKDAFLVEANIEPLLQSLDNLISEGIIYKYQVCGSLRREKDEVGDVDILVVPKDSEMYKLYLDKLELIQGKLWRGDVKFSFIYNDYIQVDLLSTTLLSFPFSSLHFTGSKASNIQLRGIAKSKGYTLNEYGLLNNSINEYVLGIESEVDIYSFLGLEYVEPRNR